MATFLLHSSSSMAAFLLHSPISHPHSRIHKIPPSLKQNLSSKPNNHNPRQITTKPKQQIPPRDRIIDFGKHKGKLLGSLPSTYLKWVSKNLRAQDFDIWAQLADQVLQDPVYNDRLEWEFAHKMLTGDVLSSSRLGSSESKSGVHELIEISERFGWDNEDKIGWSKVDFELLGTSKSGRIPRIGCGEREVEGKVRKQKNGGGDGERRGQRRERLKKMRDVNMAEKDKMGNLGVVRGDCEVGVGRMVINRNDRGGDGKIEGDRTVEISSPFPGREAFWKKVIEGKRVV